MEWIRHSWQPFWFYCFIFGGYKVLFSEPKLNNNSSKLQIPPIHKQKMNTSPTVMDFIMETDALALSTFHFTKRFFFVWDDLISWTSPVLNIGREGFYGAGD